MTEAMVRPALRIVDLAVHPTPPEDEGIWREEDQDPEEDSLPFSDADPLGPLALLPILEGTHYESTDLPRRRTSSGRAL